ncbi:MAG: ABC transporter permease subunit [Gammaproteobacteria bacterium]|nr:ABC transporter permease subunit [Gammaproteobacteria bacterium]
MIRAIAGRELRVMFASPLAWVVLAVIQFLTAWFFLGNLEYYTQVQPRLAALGAERGVTDLVIAPTLATAAVLLLLAAPLLTMRAVSEERRNDTLTLLLAAPLSALEIVLGKFLGLLALFTLMAVMIGLMPLSLLAGTNLDFGQLAAAWMALVLLLAAFAAIGLFASCLTAQPVIAAMVSFGVLLLLWVMDIAVVARGDDAPGVLSYLSMLRHFESLLQGVFDSADVAYFVILVAVFITLSTWRLEADRLER